MTSPAQLKANAKYYNSLKDKGLARKAYVAKPKQHEVVKILLAQPYESFAALEQIIRQAAKEVKDS